MSHCCLHRAAHPSVANHVISLRPIALALHLLLLGGAASLASWSPAALAEDITSASSERSYDIPAGLLTSTLTRFSRESGVYLVGAGSVAEGISSPGLKGNYTVPAGLAALLAGSGLEAVQQDDGSYGLQLAPTGNVTLPETAVTASAAAMPHELPEVYAGGQVAKRARLKSLGNADVMTTPFSIKSYTNELIKNQGARSIDDVVANDPSVRVSLSPGFVLDQSSIRGFLITGGASTIDGLPGMVSYSRIPVQNFERVEIFKGPTSALGGASVSGTTVGGSINLVPKRATVEPVTSVSAGVSSDSMLETHVDVGRRFGAENEWGARVNLYGETGDLATGTERDNLAPQLGLDYAGERFRATFDYGIIDYKNRKPGVNHALGAGQMLPSAPSGKRSAQPDTAQQALDGYWAIAGTEYDLSPDLMVYAKYGKYYEESVDSYSGTIGPLRSDGTFIVNNYAYNTWKTDQDAQEAGLRYSFDTGTIRHQATVSALRFYRLYTTVPTGQTTVINPTSVVGNIYDGYDTPYSNDKPNLGEYDGTPIRQKSFAIADSMTLLDDRLNVVFGLRQQRIEQEADSPAVPYDVKETTPTLGASYQLGGGWTVYANYAEQLSQGAVAPSGTANAGASLDPYLGKQKEVGVKWDAGNYGVTLAYFDIRQASAYTDPADNVFKAAGEQQNKGVELETFGEILPGLRLLGGVAWIDAVQTKTRLGATDDKKALGVPEWNFNLGAELDVSAVPGLTLTGRVIHTDEAYIDLANTQEVPSWTRVDLGARYLTQVSGKALTLRAGVNNVADKAYWMTGGRNLIAAAEPRTFRLNATIDF